MKKRLFIALTLVLILVVAAVLAIAGPDTEKDTYTEGDWKLRTLEDGTKEAVEFLNKGATEAVFPEGVTRIGEDVFKDCNSLISITMDSWMTNVDYGNILLLPRQTDYNTYKTTCAVVHCVSFGHYPQMADGTDDTPIQWIVLRKEGSKALLLSRYALDFVFYEFPNVVHRDGLRWENSEVRRWLNDEFLHRAFTQKEQNYILKTNVDNSVGQGYSNWSLQDDPDTVDQVFLLSIAEVNNLLVEDKIRCCVPTAYVDREYKTVIWWLRSPGPHKLYPAVVSTEGGISNSSMAWASPIRPAIWVDEKRIDGLSRTMDLPELFRAEGEANRNKGLWDEARQAFYSANDREQVNATYYAEGVQKLGEGDTEGALQAFRSANGYGDASLKISEICYAEGVAKRGEGDWNGAVKAFTDAGEYQDAAIQITETRYQQAQSLIAEEKYDDAIAILKTISDYKDSQTLIQMQNSATEDFVFERTANGECCLKEYIGNLSEITIPQYDEYGQLVTSIGKEAFSDCTSLTSITIPDGVISIGEYAFLRCTSLTSITIPDSVTSIGSRAFLACKSLISITIPGSVTSIGESTFYGCTSLASITISNGVTSIGKKAFEDCKSLTNITIPDSVITIGESPFYGCQSLKNITIPDSVIYIADGPFWFCDPSTNIVVNSGSYAEQFAKENNLSYTYADSTEKGDWDVLVLEDGTEEVVRFRNNEATEAVIPEGITRIGENAFKDCTSLLTVMITSSVTSIGKRAFYSCTSLTTITIPDSVTSIGDEAFSNCTALTSITIPDSVTNIGDGAFYCCKSLASITIPDHITNIGEDTFAICQSFTSITIPNSVNSIGVRAFDNCISLTNVVIPNSVTKIGGGAFRRCKSLTNIMIPDSVTSIGGSAFSDCTSLTSITIPDSVTSIENDVFSSCTSLTSITIPNSVTSIGESAFEYCSALTDITIPSSVIRIGNFAFQFCSSLASITIPSSVRSIGEDVFDARYNHLAVSPGSYAEQYAEDHYLPYSYAGISHEGDWELSTLEDGTKRVVKFLNTAATEAVIPDGVTVIGENAFKDCEALISITIPEGVTRIEDGAFRACTSLANVTIPSSVITIADYAFLGCRSLTNVTIHKGNMRQSIGVHTFANCASLSSITIPVSVTEIGEFAFMDCDSLTSFIVNHGSYAEQYAKDNKLPYVYAKGNP